jgi:RNA polymerase sigma-70 factor (ECF subfamily)
MTNARIPDNLLPARIDSPLLSSGYLLSWEKDPARSDPVYRGAKLVGSPVYNHWEMRQGEPIEALIEQLRNGPHREESFHLLFDRFYWPLFRFFEGRGFSVEECQDLIQETFLQVYRGIGDFRGDARWEHWLFRIAANTAVKALRHRAAAKRAGRMVPLDEEVGEESPDSVGGSSRGAEAPAPLRRLLDKERSELLSQAIAGLPGQMRRCVRLRVFQDLDYGEIADLLQISPSTVKVQLFKARKRLQIEVKDSPMDFDL